MGDLVAVQQAAQHLDELDREVAPIDPTEAERRELRIAAPRADPEHEAVAHELGDRSGDHRRLDRVAEGHEGCGAEADPFRHRPDGRQGREGVEEDAIRILELAVRFEDEMVAHPQRVEAQCLRPLRGLEQQLTPIVGAEMREQQAELHRSTILESIPKGRGRRAGARRGDVVAGRGRDVSGVFAASRHLAGGVALSERGPAPDERVVVLQRWARSRLSAQPMARSRRGVARDSPAPSRAPSATRRPEGAP